MKPFLITLFQHLGNLCFAWVLFLMVTGGWSSVIGGRKVEFSQVSLWAALMVLLLITQAALRRDFLRVDRLGWIGRLGAWVPTERRTVLAWGAFALSALILFLAHAARHWGLSTHAYDVSFVHQPLFYPFHRGHFLHADILPTQSALETHLSFGYLLLTPFTAVWKSDEVIFFIQALLLYVPLGFVIARGPLRDRRERIWIALFLVLCHRALRSASVFDFREDEIAYFACFGMLYSLYVGRIGAYFCCAVLALLSKENLFLVVGAMAAPLLWAPQVPLSLRSRKIWAAVTIILAATYAVLAFGVLIPHFTQGRLDGHPLSIRYGAYGKSASEILTNVMSSPRVWLELSEPLLRLSSVKYLLLLFGPFIGVYWAARRFKLGLWAWLLPAVPGILMNLAVPYLAQRSMTFHYELILLPFLIWSALLAVRSLDSKSPALWFWILTSALVFSDRWPLAHLRVQWPEAQAYATQLQIKAVPAQERTLRVGLRLSAQVNQWRSLEILSVEAECSTSRRDEWIAPALQSVLVARDWLLDLDSRCEREIGARLKELKCTLMQSSDRHLWFRLDGCQIREGS